MIELLHFSIHYYDVRCEGVLLRSIHRAAKEKEAAGS
jgi:hypothetical protein